MQKRSPARKFATLICAVVFCASLVLVALKFIDYRLSEKSVQKAMELAIHTASPQTTVLTEEVTTSLTTTEAIVQTNPVTTVQKVTTVTEITTFETETTSVTSEEPPEMPENEQFLFDIDVKTLQEVNPDVFGWIYIPNGYISYPLLQTDNNSHYLNHSWEDKKSSSGSIFMECRNSKVFSDFNTLIYGHNMKNYTFFAPLQSYWELSYRDEHEYIYVVTETEILRYLVFSAYEADISSDTYRLVFKDDSQKLTAIEHYTKSSVWKSEVTPTENDKILTLSTCTSSGVENKRWVVQAVLDTVWQR